MPSWGGSSARRGSSSGGKGGDRIAKLKARPHCAVSQRIGHWKGDPECPGSQKKVHMAGTEDDDHQDEGERPAE
eukprot:7398977-Pyramimonas_sp.AAC.1